MKKLAALISVPLLALSLTACSGDGDGSGNSDGASKEDVKKGLIKTYESAGYPGDDLDSFVGCMIDKSYDSLSVEARNTLAEGITMDDPDAQKKLQVSDKDDDILNEAFSDCQETP